MSNAEKEGRFETKAAAPLSDDYDILCRDEAFLRDVLDEIARARSKHAPLNSAHEGYSVILEEVDEFWAEVKKKRALRDPGAMRAELIQIAAMACRTSTDINAEEQS